MMWWSQSGRDDESRMSGEGRMERGISFLFLPRCPRRHPGCLRSTAEEERQISAPNTPARHFINAPKTRSSTPPRVQNLQHGDRGEDECTAGNELTSRGKQERNTHFLHDLLN